MWRLFENSSDRGRAQVQAGPAERLGDLDLTHARAKELQPLDTIADEVGEFVDGLRQLDERNL